MNQEKKSALETFKLTCKYLALTPYYIFWCAPPLISMEIKEETIKGWSKNPPGVIFVYYQILFVLYGIVVLYLTQNLPTEEKPSFLFFFGLPAIFLIFFMIWAIVHSEINGNTNDN